MRVIALAIAVAVVSSSSSWANINEDASLAMHVVATGEYLDCQDLCPAEMTCLAVDCDLRGLQGT